MLRAISTGLSSVGEFREGALGGGTDNQQEMPDHDALTGPPEILPPDRETLPALAPTAAEVALQVENVAIAASGLRLHIARSKTDPDRLGAEIGLPRGKHVETCPLRAFEDRQIVAQRQAEPLFRRIGAGDRIGALVGPASGRGAADPGAPGAASLADAGRARTAQRACAAGQIHHRDHQSERAGRRHHAPHPPSRFTHHAWLRTARQPHR
jgi:hypothetical protein